MKRTCIVLSFLLTIVAVFAGCSENVTKEQLDPSRTKDPSIIEQDQGSDWSCISSEGILRIGFTEYEVPGGYKDESLSGFCKELAEAVCERLGVMAEIVYIGGEETDGELKDKTIDCIWNCLKENEDYNYDDFSKAYFCIKQAAVISIGTAEQYTKPEDFKGLTVAAEEGSAGAAALSEAFPGAKLLAVGSQEDALAEIKSGTAEAAVIELAAAEAMTGEGNRFADLLIVHSISLSAGELAVRFRSGSDMPEKVNKILDDMNSDGSLKAIAEMYGIGSCICSE